jgi:hypothetical protein
MSLGMIGLFMWFSCRLHDKAAPALWIVAEWRRIDAAHQLGKRNQALMKKALTIPYLRAASGRIKARRNGMNLAASY